MKTLASLLTCFLLLSSWLQAQETAVLSGTVVDAQSGEPLLGASLQTVDYATVTSYVDGSFRLELPKGRYELEVRYIGYQALTRRIDLQEDQVIEIALQETGNILDEATVTSSKFAKPLGQVTVSMDIIKPELIENTNATAIDEVLERSPGLNIIDGQANIRGGSGYSYGAGSRVLLLMDDMPILAGDAGFPNWRDIPVENIGQIEVLKGAASALYGSAAMNGIIHVRRAYATSEPVTKFSAFHTSYGQPQDASIAWWQLDSIRVGGLRSTPGDTTLRPGIFQGRPGYRKPQQLGFQFAHRQKIKKLDLILGGNYFYNDGFRAGEYDRKYRASTSLRYRFSDKLQAGVHVNYNAGSNGTFFLWGNSNVPVGRNRDSLRYMPFGIAGADNGSITESLIERYTIDPFLNYYDKFGNQHKILSRWFSITNDAGLNQSNTSNLRYGEYQFQRRFSDWGNLSLTSGVVGQHTSVDAELYGNAAYSISNVAAYLQLDKAFFQEEGPGALNLSVGLRYERNVINSPDTVVLRVDTQTGDVLEQSANPEPRSAEGRPVLRFGANYQAAKATYLRASFGQAYRFPTIAERYIATSVSLIGIRPNPELQSETGWSAELGLKQGFKISDWKGYVDVALFWTEYQNMMEFTFGGGDLDNPGGLGNLFFQSINIGDTRIAGSEFSIMGTGKIAGLRTNVIGGYTFIDPRFKDFNEVQQTLSSNDSVNVLKYRARHSAKMDIESFFLNERLSVGLTFQYNSYFEAIDRIFADLTPTSEDYLDFFGVHRYEQELNPINAWFTLGIRLGYKLPLNEEKKQFLKLSLVGNNLNNAEYQVRPALLAPPRHLSVRVDVQF